MTTPKLSPFEGRDVLRSTIAIINAGDGLSDAMKVEPTEFHHGDRVYVVLECEVARVQFVPYDKSDPHGPITRVHTLRAGTATVVDEDLVGEQVAAMAERVLQAKEAEAGIVRLEFEEDEAAAEPGEERAETAAEGDPVPADTWEDADPPPATTSLAAKAAARSRKRAT